MSSTPQHHSLPKSPCKKRALETEGEWRLPKRRRSSVSFGFVLHTELASEAEESDNDHAKTNSSRDRFLPTLTTKAPFYDINTGTQPARLARALGLIQPRLLSFHDDTLSPLFSHHLSDPTLPTRTHLSQSLFFDKAGAPSTHSAAKHGKHKPERVLDSGPMDDFPLHPCAWSLKDVIAAVIRDRVFMHEMEGNKVTELAVYGDAACVEWTSDIRLAVGCDKGEIAQHDTSTGKLCTIFSPRNVYNAYRFDPLKASENRVNTMNWSAEHNLLAAGRETGEVVFVDPRCQEAIRSDMGPAKRFVTNVKWSPDGMFLASGHKGGIVRCMDWRAGKSFELHMPHDIKAHKWVVRSLAWAPWSPHLLATGGGSRDHTVKVWSISGSEKSSHSELRNTILFSACISSLHFSPHTTEILSTHGEPAVSPSPRSRSSRSFRRSSSLATDTTAPFKVPVTRHGITVHTYPSFERVHTVQNAHAAPIIDSVLSPDGTRVMTFGEDETLRQWTVWGSRTPEKVFRMVDRLDIR